MIRHSDNRGDIQVLPESTPLPIGYKVLLKTGDYQEAVAARAVLRLAPDIDSLEGSGVYGGP